MTRWYPWLSNQPWQGPWPDVWYHTDMLGKIIRNKTDQQHKGKYGLLFENLGIQEQVIKQCSKVLHRKSSNEQYIHSKLFIGVSHVVNMWILLKQPTTTRVSTSNTAPNGYILPHISYWVTVSLCYQTDCHSVVRLIYRVQCFNCTLMPTFRYVQPKWTTSDTFRQKLKYFQI